MLIRVYLEHFGKIYIDRFVDQQFVDQDTCDSICAITIQHKFLSSVNHLSSYFFFSFPAHIIPALGMIVFSSLGCDATASVIVLALSFGMNGAIASGHFQAFTDIVPNFSGECLYKFCTHVTYENKQKTLIFIISFLSSSL